MLLPDQFQSELDIARLARASTAFDANVSDVTQPLASPAAEDESLHRRPVTFVIPSRGSAPLLGLGGVQLVISDLHVIL